MLIYLPSNKHLKIRNTGMILKTRLLLYFRDDLKLLMSILSLDQEI